MPLHPTAAKLIADAKASGRPNAHLLPVDEARRNFESDWAEVPKPDIAVAQDLEIPTADGQAIPARLYRSGGTPSGAPVLVWFHGGGWLIGSVDSHDGLSRRLAIATGSVVVSVGYRLAPEWRFPTAVNDAVDAVRWVSAHARVLGVDTDRLAVGGDSAGGNLATVAAVLLRDEPAVRIRHQLLAYPVTTCDLNAGFDPEFEGIMLYRDELQWHQDNYLTDPSEANDPRVSPLLADLAHSPAATVIMAECDPIRPQAELYVAALERAGVPVESRQYPGMLHGFFGLDVLWDEAGQAMDWAAARLTAAVSGTR
jgi:acetyl esterase/lipase